MHEQSQHYHIQRPTAVLSFDAATKGDGENIRLPTCTYIWSPAWPSCVALHRRSRESHRKGSIFRKQSAAEAYGTRKTKGAPKPTRTTARRIGGFGIGQPTENSIRNELKTRCRARGTLPRGRAGTFPRRKKQPCFNYILPLLMIYVAINGYDTPVGMTYAREEYTTMFPPFFFMIK